MAQMEGLVAIVTGASRGLGKAIAMEYGREGAKVVVCARPQSPTSLPGTSEDTAGEIESGGGQALAISCDVTDEGQVQTMVERVMKTYGRIDVLVNNAGTNQPEPFETVAPETLDRLLNLNIRAAFLAPRLGAESQYILAFASAACRREHHEIPRRLVDPKDLGRA